MDTPDCDTFLKRSVTASGTTTPPVPTSIIPTVPAAHFAPRELTAATPLTVTDDGAVYGHVALDGICHVGYPTCVTMPKSAASLAYFHTGVVRLDNASDLNTGRITVKGAHAPIDLGWKSAMAHYDDTTTTIADVIAYEDEFGIAVAGHVRSDAPPSLVHVLRASTPSGDWRAIGSAAELINIHMVNSPGFPVYRTDSQGSVVASIAASAAPAIVASGGWGTPVDDDLDRRITAQVEYELSARQLSDSFFAAHADDVANTYRDRMLR